MPSRLPEAYHLWNIPPVPHGPSPHSYILSVWSLESLVRRAYLIYRAVGERAALLLFLSHQAE